ncbi:hypothetical protein [Clostridium sp.]|uniref:hypothetical protein n=1 Tax=Clostridium sp. TaxID=1506 RepID=UPI00263847F4|nr:hypothetical protein [Clostridium sp.]
MSKGDMGFKEFIELLGWSKNKFFENIKRICSKEVYDIDIGKFRKSGETKLDYEKDDKNFCFKDGWKDLTYVLFTMFTDNPFYRKSTKANNVTLESIIKYNTDSLKMIEQELPNYQRRQIQLHPVYEATLIETKAMKNVSEKIQLLLATISKFPIETRTELWVNFDKLINYQLIQSYLSTIEAKEQFGKEKGELFKNQLFGEYEHISLDKYLAEVLKREMDDEFIKERDSIGKMYSEAQQDLDNIYMSVCEDTPEQIEVINNMYDDLGLDKLLDNFEGWKTDQFIKERLTEAANMIENNTSVDNTIDEIINELKKSNEEHSKEQIKKLQEIKGIISDNSKDIENFSNIADKILCEINYNIINRTKSDE